MQDELEPLFQRGRFYVAPRMAALQTAFVASAAHRRVASFACQLGTPRLAPLLRQCIMAGSAPVLPASAALEMATAATRLLDEHGGVSILQSAVLLQQLLLGDEDTVRTSVAAGGAVTMTAADGSFILQAAASCVRSSSPAAPARAQPAASAAVLHVGILTHVTRASAADVLTPNAVSKPLAALSLQRASTADGFWTHPGLLASTMALAGGSGFSNVGVWFPSGIMPAHGPAHITSSVTLHLKSATDRSIELDSHGTSSCRCLQM